MKIQYRRGLLATTWIRGDIILLHEGLQEPEFKALREKLIAHEQEHETKPFTLKDLTIDMNFNSWDPDVFYFSASHPDSLLQLTGIIPHEGKLLIDKGQILTLALITLVGGLTWILV